MTEAVRQKKIKVEIHNDHYTIYNGSMLDMLEVIQPNSIDSIVCDPPYELNFMNKGWDNGGISFNPDTWKKCYEVLKPGGYLLAFGGSRTFHRMAVAIEDAGFEIRDTIMWLYGSGFPKSMNIGKAVESKLTTGSSNTQEFKKLKGDRIDTKIGFTRMQFNHGARPNDYTENSKSVINVEYSTEEGKQWNGWGTALKPAYEPIIVARKPFKGSLVDNVLTYGVGGINIDECRVGESGGVKKINIEPNSGSKNSGFGCNRQLEELNDGRFPANVIHDGSDEVESLFPYTESGNLNEGHKRGDGTGNSFMGGGGMIQKNYGGDSGSAARFFYAAKASKKDRDEGLEFWGFEEKQVYGNDMIWGYGNNNGDNFGERIANVKRKNIHPTVKPCELMQYLVRLVSPKGATILDPFMGSGSTGKAVMFENRERNANYKFIGIDLEEKYCQIAIARIDYALNKFECDYIKEKQEAEARGQANIFDFIEVN